MIQIKKLRNSILLFLIALVNIDFISSETLKVIDFDEIINEFTNFCSEEVPFTSWANTKTDFLLFYEGAELPPASMIFLSNSIMILQSGFYSIDRLQTNRFFKYQCKNNEIRLIAIDSRLAIVRWQEVETYHKDNGLGILSVDEDKKSVVYDFSKGEILYGGFYYNSFGLIPRSLLRKTGGVRGICSPAQQRFH